MSGEFFVFFFFTFISLFCSTLMIAVTIILQIKAIANITGHIYLFVERVEKRVGNYHNLPVAHFFSVLFFAFYPLLISWFHLLSISNIHFRDFKFCLFVPNTQNLWKAEVPGLGILRPTWLCTSGHEINLFKTQLVISSPLLQPKQGHLSLAASFHLVAHVIVLA